jgi:hypothetical protein
MFGEQYRSSSYSLCSFLHSPVTTSLLGTSILNTLFSNILSLRSSQRVYTLFCKSLFSVGVFNSSRTITNYFANSCYCQYSFEYETI